MKRAGIMNHPIRYSLRRAPGIAALPLCLAIFAPSLHASTAALWIPREHAPIEDVVSRLEASPELKLTAALGEVPPAMSARIAALSSAGRLETVARPSGDPIIPLFYYPGDEAVRWSGAASSAAVAGDPFFLSLRLGRAREDYAAKFKHYPAAFVDAPGCAIAAYVPLARALGFGWLAAGAPQGSTSPYRMIDAEGVKLVLFSPPGAASEPSASAEFLVFDETGEKAGDSMRAALLNFLSSPGRQQLTTVTEELAAAPSTAVPAAQAALLSAPWSGGLAPWTASPAQTGALAAFARTRTALLEYYNSLQGDNNKAEPAFAEYFSVESGPKLLKLADPDPEIARETEIEIQNALANSYRLMGKVPPGWLFSSLSDIGAAAETEDKVSLRRSTDGFVIVNIARPPEPPAKPASVAQDPYKIWKLSEVSVSWTEGDVTFGFRPLASAPGGLPPGARFDLYIDINNRPRAGSARLLEGRRGRLFPDNAWEYALTASPNKAALYSATVKGPQLLRNYQVSFRDGALTVQVPRSDIKGTPERWSYLALMLFTADDAAYSTSDYLAEDLSNGYFYAVKPSGRNSSGPD